MKIRPILLATVATGAITLAALTVAPVIHPEMFAAQAATNVSIDISIGTFYDRLSPHGDWVSYRDRYVWVPGHIDAGWRPYTRGHWAYTKRHGWLWVSDEPFGWATYHYGRWGYTRDIGWYWVPGRRWAPAWVAWHRTDRDIAWAPLPPDYDDGDDVSVFYSKAPAHYWQVVPVNFFLSINISEHIDRDRDHVRRVIRDGETGTVRIENNIVVNNYIDVDFIEKRTKKEVVVHEVKAADDPQAAGKTEEGKVAVFDPEVKEEADAKPAKTKNVEEVAKERKASVEETEEPAVEESTAPADGTDGEKKPEAAETQEPAAGEQPADDQSVKKAKKAATESDAMEEAPAAAETQPADDQSVKKAKKAAAEGEAMEEAPAAAETQPADDQSVKKAKKAAAEGEAMEEAPAAADTQPADDQSVKKQKKAATEGAAPESEAAAEQPISGEAAAEGEAASGQQKQANDQGECDPQKQECGQAQ